MSNYLPDLNGLIKHIALHNSENAYEKLFKYLFPSLYRFCFYLLKSRELAEEAASDVMITIWRNREKLSDVKNVKVYAFVIARNLSLNIINKQAKQEWVAIDDLDMEIILDNLNPEQLLINGELKKKLERAVETLPAQCKLVFKLIKEDGLSYKETANILNISIKTVDAHLVSAIKKLTTVLQAEFNLT
ncbi:RNA polymerase sigma factor [Pedobacter ginsengisoli]|jgi:RNA polymerase sigma-70 factor (ECF subfamily)|uniref:RNA polymerase sigma factor n=1 Tax=Pedobacter ginsengisoli TaxID=363852 RepID=UPI00254C6F29|nr:RNA polymerase sigma-70 factor [Pedobacter ginsengisoli]